MSNVVWSADKGWHDGEGVTVTADAGRIVVSAQATAETVHFLAQTRKTLAALERGMITDDEAVQLIREDLARLDQGE